MYFTEYLSAKDSLAIHSQFKYANDKLWGYLRLGLNYLESPKPFSLPESIQPTYRHPDLRGFGAYGFSSETYKDVQRLYPFFKNYSWEDILKNLQRYVAPTLHKNRSLGLCVKHGT